MKKTCLLTGATGMLGSFLVTRAVAEGSSLAVLVRDKGAIKAEQRISEQVRIVAGDLSLPDLGVSSEDRAWLQEHCDHVVHAGAKVTFLAQPRTGEPYRTNIDGTRFVLNFCKKLGIERLSYVSTAYVCGDRNGPIDEHDLECGQGFHNDYERSKYVAECLVRGADFLATRTIFRPSVVMGDSSTGFTPSYHTIYNLVQLAWLSRGIPREQLLAAAEIGPADTINLVPGDWVAEAVWSQALHQEALKTYHLTHPCPVTVAELLDAVDSLPRPEGTRALALTPEDTAEILKPLRGYLRRHPGFRSSVATRPPQMDREVLRKLCQYAVDHNFTPIRPKVSLDDLLNQFPLGKVAPQLTLEFSDGRKTHLNFQERLPRVSSTGQSDNTAFMREDIFEGVLSGTLSLNDALAKGALVLESDDADACLVYLKSLFSHLSGSVN